MHVLLIGEQQDRYERLIDSVKPETSVEIEMLSGWNQFWANTDDHVTEGDLIIALSPHKGFRSWEPKLDDYHNISPSRHWKT